VSSGLWLVALLLTGFVFTVFVFGFLTVVVARSICEERAHKGGRP